MKPTLLVIGFLGEQRLLELQARSIAKYASDVFENILYVSNERNPSAFRQLFEDKLARELGQMADVARVIDGNSVANMSLTRTDWRSQQSLKLLAPRFSNSASILILDCKNHFVRPVSSADFINSDDRMITYRYPVNARFAEQFKNACDYFGIEPPSSDFAALPTVAPFMMDRDTVGQMIDVVEKRENQNFHDFFCGNKRFTEFYFYLAYLLSRSAKLEALYEGGPRKHVTVFRSMADNPTQALEQLSHLKDKNITILGVHRQVLAQANLAILAAITQQWITFGLVRDEQEAAYFLTPDLIKRTRWYWPF